MRDMTRLLTSFPKLIALAGALIAFDRLFKQLAAARFRSEALELVPGVLTFEHFRNFGIAFSIPFSGPLLWVISIFLIAFFGVLAFRKPSKNPAFRHFGFFLFLFGSFSNLFDRVIYGWTVDYLIFFGRSAVNIADGMILAGAIIILFLTGPKKVLPAETPPPLAP